LDTSCISCISCIGDPKLESRPGGRPRGTTSTTKGWGQPNRAAKGASSHGTREEDRVGRTRPMGVVISDDHDPDAPITIDPNERCRLCRGPLAAPFFWELVWRDAHRRDEDHHRGDDHRRDVFLCAECCEMLATPLPVWNQIVSQFEFRRTDNRALKNGQYQPTRIGSASIRAARNQKPRTCNSPA